MAYRTAFDRQGMAYIRAVAEGGAAGRNMVSDGVDLFPPSPRVIYERAPLIQVAAQLRFPPILKIEGQAPADFQERIRDIFPLFEKPPAFVLPQLPQMPPLPPEIARIIGAQIGGTSYQFLTENRQTTVSLTTDTISLSTSSYVHWEQFREQFRGPMTALSEIYRPAFFSRVGLRYIDAIDRDSLGIRDRRWSELFRPELLGELALRPFEDHLETVGRSIRVKIPDGTGSVLLRHGLGTVQGTQALSYVIDFDLFKDTRTEVNDAGNLLDHFNQLGGRAFRWCITDTLRDALRPRPVAAGN
jgi:uncharacterized protein (TIGR04255 family)